MKTLDQVRRSHASARPKHDNPSWLHTHQDLTFVLGQLDEALADIGVLTEQLHGSLAEGSCWLIECGSPAEYFCGGMGWCSNPYHALRFATKVGAEKRAASMTTIEPLRVAEHLFESVCSLPPRQAVPIRNKALADKYGLALMMIREGCANPADFARRILAESEVERLA